MNIVKRLLNMQLSRKARILLAVFVLFAMVGGGVMAYYFYDFTQNNPRFCVSCHLMQPAFDKWSESVHNEINCHDCHHLTIAEQNELLVNFVVKRPDTVPPRHGEVIVPWKYCVACHWDTNEKFPDAPKVNNSPLHSKHYFKEQIECAKCHGYKVHEFTPEERFCMKCHQGKTVHGTGMEELACLNCHTDRTENLRPGRKKCLFCHGGEEVREELIADGTIDVKNYQPDPAIINGAIKIQFEEDSPMQFRCYDCHKPHEANRPDWGNCINCHKAVPKVGKHDLHINMMGMSCGDCHKPHKWRVSDKDAKKLCTTCHEYKTPEMFLK